MAPFRVILLPGSVLPGELAYGSLVAALGSWLDARSRGGAWLVRMEDIDRPREIPGAADAILRGLEACGLEWDGPVLYQSRRTAVYAAVLEGEIGRASCRERV